MKRIFITLAILLMFIGCGGGDGDQGTSERVSYLFQADMNDDEFPYGFEFYSFGYTDNPIHTYHDSTGGVNDSGCHRIPLQASDGTYLTNFDVHFGKDIPNLTSYYLRFYLWVNPTFNTDPGANWKLTYNYHENQAFVFWMRPTADGQGFQPSLYSTVHGEVFRTEPVPTFYLANFKGQWICFEYYVNLTTQQAKLWITTEDGQYNETLYVNSPFYNSGTSVYSIKIGAFWDGQGDDNYFKLDEVVISDSYIGPLR